MSGALLKEKVIEKTIDPKTGDMITRLLVEEGEEREEVRLHFRNLDDLRKRLRGLRKNQEQ